MSFAGPATVLGGLPVWAECWATRGDGYSSDDDAGVVALYWLRKDGTKGKEVTQKVYERLDAKDTYWQATVTEQVSEYLAYRQQSDTTTVELI